MKCPLCLKEMKNTIWDKSWVHDHSSVLWHKLAMKQEKEIERLKKENAKLWKVTEIGYDLVSDE